MEDTKLHEDQIAGLKTKIKQLRSDKDLFVKAQGMAQEAENLRGQAEKMREDIKILKDSNAALIAKKNSAVSKSLEGIVKKMREILPEGMPILTVSDEGDIFIGWQKEGKQPVSYSGLSGGEKVIFDATLVYALKANIIVSEFAELDDERLPLALEKFKDMDVQVICSSCHDIRNVPKEFQTILL
jgi:DNA repair exonuclease SbcCD ATPase subunit